ncbi:MAG TPA: histidine kinase [Longimicrobiaceae bacterium]|nr:histidine kinase [Longimicrobiaceae bacterium]
MSARRPLPPLLRQLLVSLAVWTALSLVFVQTVALNVASRAWPIPWGRIAAKYLTAGCLWAVYTLLVFRAVRRWPLYGPERRWRNLAPHGGILLALSAADAALVPPLVFGKGAPPMTYGEHFLAVLPSALVYYALVATVGSALVFLERLREEERRSAGLVAQLAQAQLSALRAQLHPHFFFNTLNAVAELIHRDPDAADRMVTRLGAFMRRSLDTADRQEVPLGEEVEALETYLDVVRLRFGDRVRVALDVDPAALGCRVPALVLQPLVENALKHGLEPREGPGHLRVSGRLEGSRLVLEVRDDGAGLPPDGRLTERVGLRNTRERLRQLYGAAGELTLRPVAGGGTAVTVALPAGDTGPGPHGVGVTPAGAGVGLRAE